jgi:hypothetical protein
LITGIGPSRWLTSWNGPDGADGGVSITTPLTLSHLTRQY